MHSNTDIYKDSNLDQLRNEIRLRDEKLALMCQREPLSKADLVKPICVTATVIACVVGAVLSTGWFAFAGVMVALGYSQNLHREYERIEDEE